MPCPDEMNVSYLFFKFLYISTGPFNYNGLTFIIAWISNYMPSKGKYIWWFWLLVHIIKMDPMCPPSPLRTYWLNCNDQIMSSKRHTPFRRWPGLERLVYCVHYWTNVTSLLKYKKSRNYLCCHTHTPHVPCLYLRVPELYIPHVEHRAV